jgi:OOP family OmpA-OmpF porin
MGIIPELDNQKILTKLRGYHEIRGALPMVNSVKPGHLLLGALISISLSSHASPLLPDSLMLGVKEADPGIRDGLLENSEDYRHGFAYSLSAGWTLRPRLELNLSLDMPAITQDENRPEISGAGLAAHYYLSDGRLRPYLGAGLQHLTLEPAESGIVLPGSATGIELIGGLHFTFSPNVFGRIQASRNEAFNDDLRISQYQLILGYRFGHTPVQRQTTVMPAPEPAVVEPATEQQPVPIIEPEVIILPPDHDNDGVATASDQCPDTPPGMMVNSVGCSPFDLALTGITFETNSARLTQDSKAILDGIASDLRPFPELKIEIQAHTDDRGSAQYNLRLSQLRAESVRNYLIRKGLKSTNLIARGYGETAPKYDNNTVEGRAQNRRVELHFLASDRQ